MGSGPSKQLAVPTPEPIPTTVTVRTTAVTVPTTVSTSAADFKTPEVKCWINDHEILYMSLALISGILLTLLVFAIIYFCRKHKRSHQNSQEQVPSQAATQESANTTQNEVTYTTLVFQRSRAPLAV